MRRLPGILSDVDGVILRGKSVIRGSDIVLNKLLTKQYTNGSITSFIPFACLTNGGGMLEHHKSAVMNKLLHL